MALRQIDAARIVERLEQLFALGEPPHANRPGLGEAEERALELVSDWMREAGLAVERDSAGNLYGRLAGRETGTPEVWTGSHLDTVPAGGRYDGALGVVAGVEAVQQLAGRGVPRRTVAVIAFRDEEGWRFGSGLFGSRAVSGQVGAGELSDADGGGVTRGDALAALGLTREPASWSQPLPSAYIELHVEQGPRLAESGHAVGCVTGIAAMWGGRASFAGHAGHAGTTPMARRADAGLAAASSMIAIRDLAAALPGAVATVGEVRLTPGADNVIPGRAMITLDLRSPDDPTLDRLRRGVEEVCRERARADHCEASVSTDWQQPARVMHQAVVGAIRRSARSAGALLPELASGAGHDAGALAAASVPTGMIFARSLAHGVSHSPREHTDVEAIEISTRVLAGAIAELAGFD